MRLTSIVSFYPPLEEMEYPNILKPAVFVPADTEIETVQQGREGGRALYLCRAVVEGVALYGWVSELDLSGVTEKL